MEAQQILAHQALSRIRRQIWRFTVTISILAAVGFGIVWCVDHGVLAFNPTNYHAVSDSNLPVR